MKKVTLAVAALALTASVSAFAANTGTYVGLGLGASKLDATNLNSNYPTYNQSLKTGGLGERIFAGYNFNPYIGAELGLANYAQSKYTTTAGPASGTAKYNMQALDLVAKAYLPVSNTGFNVYALGGIAYVNSKVDVSETLNPIAGLSAGNTTTRKVRPIVGLGASYDINSCVTTAVEYSHIQGTGDLKTSNKAIPNADMVSLNLSYNFG